MSVTAGIPPPPRCLACGRIIRRRVALNGGASAQMCDGCHEAAEARMVAEPHDNPHT